MNKSIEQITISNIDILYYERENIREILCLALDNNIIVRETDNKKYLEYIIKNNYMELLQYMLTNPQLYFNGLSILYTLKQAVKYNNLELLKYMNNNISKDCVNENYDVLLSDSIEHNNLPIIIHLTSPYYISHNSSRIYTVLHNSIYKTSDYNTKTEIFKIMSNYKETGRILLTDNRFFNDIIKNMTQK